MTSDAEYGPSTWSWVARQVEQYEASGGTAANTLTDTGIPIILFSTVGRKSGLVRKVPLMRVEHDGHYALIASKGGDPSHPGWYHNLLADDTVVMQDGAEPWETQVRELEGDERQAWWDRGVAVYPPYEEYQAKTDRRIPVFVTETPKP
ncbi:MAG: nitroreductase family deazaflavin-dependent oxidoreductase [Acidimicrobiales bacterium]